MRHEVPQFIDIKDKIFWSLTFMQGLYLAGGIFGGFIIFYLIGKVWPEAPVFIKLTLGAPILAFGIALAFVEINKRPFIKYIEAFFYYTISPKKYIWKKKKNKKDRKIEELSDDFTLPGEQNSIYTIENNSYMTKNKRSRLKTLAHDLDMDIE